MSAGALRAMVEDDRTRVLPGAPNALTARILEDIGFDVLYATGAGITNSAYARPDLGLLTMTEMAEEVRRICDAVSVPVIADADTGFGGSFNVMRTVEYYERAGVAGLQLEDQEHPKRCGHFEGTSVVSTDEMVTRIEAARRARHNTDLVLIARTDARASLGLQEAIRRANIYHAAGADLLFVEAPRSADEVREVGRSVDAPIVVNLVEEGRTPIMSLQELCAVGCSFALYANTALRLSIRAIQTGMRELLTDGSSQALGERIAPWSERQRLVGLSTYEQLEQEIVSTAALTGPSLRPERTAHGTEVP